MTIQEQLDLREQMIIDAVEALEECYAPESTRLDLCYGISSALAALTPSDELLKEVAARAEATA